MDALLLAALHEKYIFLIKYGVAAADTDKVLLNAIDAIEELSIVKEQSEGKREGLEVGAKLLKDAGELFDVQSAPCNAWAKKWLLHYAAVLDMLSRKKGNQ